VPGRKNRLFNKSPEGAESSCGMYSLIETARQNGLDPLEYLRTLFERCPLAKTSGDWEKLLPGTFSPLNLTDTGITIRLFEMVGEMGFVEYLIETNIQKGFKEIELVKEYIKENCEENNKLIKDDRYKNLIKYIIDLFNNPVGYRTSLAVFQAKALQNRVF
jgi:hypothetical protein